MLASIHIDALSR